MFQKLITAGVAAGTLLVASTVMASILSFGTGAASIQGVTISDTAVATVAGRVSNLSHVASGLRTKNIAEVHVPIYVAQLFATTDSNKVACTVAGTLASLDAKPTVAISMSFVYSVDAAQVLQSFQDSFDANNINSNNPEIVNFLAAIQNAGPALTNTNFIIVGEKLADGTEAVTFENSQGQDTTVPGPKGFVKEIMSIWLGQPAAGDTDLATLINTLETCGAQ